MLNYAGYKEWKENYDKHQEELKQSKDSLFEQIQTNKRKADSELVIKKKKGISLKLAKLFNNVNVNNIIILIV